MGISIFNYLDYRDYLKDYYAHSKRTNPKFSYKYFAIRAQLAAPHLLCMVMNGQRNLSRDVLQKVAKGLALRSGERHYFETLVAFNQAKAPEAKRYYFGLLSGLRRGKPGTLLSAAQYEYLSNWFFPVIRELVAFPDFSDDPRWICAKLARRISARDARRAVETLLHLGLVTRTDDGKYLQTDAGLTTGDDVAGVAVVEFHEQMMALARDILKTTCGKRREISATTAAVSQQQFEEIKSMVRDFRRRVEDYLTHNPGKPDSVYQINIQMIPLTADAAAEEA